MRDPFSPTDNSKLIREAQAGLSLVAILFILFVYVAYYRISGFGRTVPDHVRRAPIAESVWPHEHPGDAAVQSDRAVPTDNQSRLVQQSSHHDPIGPAFDSSEVFSATRISRSEPKAQAAGLDFTNQPVPTTEAGTFGAQTHTGSRAQLKPQPLRPTDRNPVPSAIQITSQTNGPQDDPFGMDFNPKKQNHVRTAAYEAHPAAPFKQPDMFAKTNFENPASDNHQQQPDANSFIPKANLKADLKTESKIAIQPSVEKIKNPIRSNSIQPSAIPPSTIRPATTNSNFELRPQLKAPSPIANQTTLPIGASHSIADTGNTQISPNDDFSTAGNRSPNLKEPNSIGSTSPPPPPINQNGLRQPHLTESAQALPVDSTPVAKFETTSIPETKLPISQPNPTSRPTFHIAQTGDSFWSIAQMHYDDGNYFRALYAHNQDRVTDFETLAPGTRIDTPTAAELNRRWPQLVSPTTDYQADQTEVDVAFINAQAPPSTLDNTYRTRAGDTLFGIAAQRLGQASRYLEILQLNQNRLPADINHLSPLPSQINLRLPD